MLARLLRTPVGWSPASAGLRRRMTGGESFQ